jgi:hypothetical protein
LLRAAGRSSRKRDADASIVMAVDAVAILLGIAVFAILLVLIAGIERV